MSFPPGRALGALIAVAACSGTILLMQANERPQRADLVLWVFAEPHYRIYTSPGPNSEPSLVEQFTRRTGLTVDVQLISSRAADVRLMSLFMANRSGAELPDLVEIEIGQISKYFRPPTDQIGLLPLNDYLAQSGSAAKLLPSRLAPWMKSGAIFGIPHDVHPVAICYRDDLFREAGIDLSQAKTWPVFQQRCAEFQRYWSGRKFPQRHAIELSSSASDELVIMLLQRGINLVDNNGEIHLEDPRVAQTLAFYAQLVAGERRIAGESTGGAGAFVRDLNDGNLCAFFTPDWRVGLLKHYTEIDENGRTKLAGRVRLMPLPVFDAGDAPTSTWGGTMIGITRRSSRPGDAWKLIEWLYLSQKAVEAQRRYTSILPPVPQWWDDPAYSAIDPFFGGQRAQKLYVELAGELPSRQVAAATPIAQALLSAALGRATEYVNARGSDGLEEACRDWMSEASAELRRRIAHGETLR